MSQAVTKELPYTGLPPSRHPEDMGGQLIPNGQLAPPSYTAPADSPSSSRLLHVYHSGMSHRNTQILGPDKTTVLYTVRMNSGSLFGSKPHVTVYRADTGTVVGTARFHSISREIDMVIHNNPIAFSPSGIFTSAHEWTSLATTTEGKRMQLKWKRDKIFSGGDMLCLDQQQKVCAKFENSTWALKKDGKFEVGPFVSGVLMDEVVVTGLAMLEARRRENNSAAGASAAGASAAGC